MAINTQSKEFILGKTTPGMPSYNPTVQPSPLGGDSLQGTMTTPPPPKKTNPFVLSQVMDALQTKVTTNNTLMSSRNLLLKHLYDQPLSEQEKSQLDPTLVDAINKGDKDQIDMRLRLISDEIQGRNTSLDRSVQYLTKAYNDTITQAENQKQEAINNVLQFAQVYGSQAKNALKSLYGDEYVEQLKEIGIDLDSFGSVDTIAEREKFKGTTPTGGAITLSDGTTVTKDTINFDDPAVVEKLPVSMLTKAVISGTGTLKDLTPTDKAAVIAELYAVGFNPHDVVMRKLNDLADLWAGVPEGYKGLVQGFLPSRFDKGAAQKFESAKEVLTRVVARLNDVGMLSDQDVASYKKAMPARNDRNLDAVKAKIEGIGTAVGSKQKKEETVVKNGMTFKKNPDGSYTRTK